MSNWFERCECGEYVNVKHECIYNDKDLMIQHLQDKIEVLESKSYNVPIDTKKKCSHKKTKHIIEHNSYPYGDTVRYDQCLKCDKILNLKVK